MGIWLSGREMAKGQDNNLSKVQGHPYNGIASHWHLNQQDNAPIHTSQFTRNALAHWGITVPLNWPPYSPDLNSIKHAWPHLKEALYDLRSDLDKITSLKEQ